MTKAKRKGRPRRPTGQMTFDEAMHQLKTRPLLSVAAVKALTGSGKNQVYAIAKEGRWDAFKIGSVFYFPAASVRLAMRLSDPPAAAKAAVQHEVA